MSHTKKMKQLLVACALLMSLRLHADCVNIHCKFEFLGAAAVEGAEKDDFMRSPAVGGNADRHFERECMPFRELNWHLSRLEAAAGQDDRQTVSNAVGEVVRILDDYEAHVRKSGLSGARPLPLRLRMALIEKIEYALARMVLGRGRGAAAEFLDELLPDDIFEESRDVPSWHSLLTFKRMLRIAAEVENYTGKEGCRPLNLNVLKLPEADRKCACGRDVEYEQHGGTWILRSRCESYDGGLGFDEYIPMIYQQRKRLDLCLSNTFNAKRAALFNGDPIGADDNRLRGRVCHDGGKDGVHQITFSSPSAGTGRIVPFSEQAKEDGKRQNRCDTADD